MTHFLTLHPKQLKKAMAVAVRVIMEDVLAKRPNKYGINEGAAGWVENIDGMAAEAAYCEFRGIEWEDRVGDFERPDVGEKTEIRSTRWSHGRLILNDKTKDDRFYVLVRQHTEFEIVGWIRGDLGKQVAVTEQHRPNGATLYVPNECLTPFT
jgi:hypothetical protein